MNQSTHHSKIKFSGKLWLQYRTWISAFFLYLTPFVMNRHSMTKQYLHPPRILLGWESLPRGLGLLMNESLSMVDINTITNIQAGNVY